MQKHAYLITSNGNIAVLSTCLQLLDDERNDFYILFDKKAKITSDVRKELSSKVKAANIIYLADYQIDWGGVSQVVAELRLLEASTPCHYSYYHYLQGADLPIKNKKSILEYFDSHQGTEFVSVEFNRQNMAESKCLYYHLFCHNKYFRSSKLMKALNFGCVYIQKLLGIKHNTDIKLYHSSALFSITDDFAQYVLSKKDEILKRFRFALAPDEVFLATVLMNSRFRENLMYIDNNHTSNARLIDRTRPDGKNSPHIWRREELDYILKQPKDFCFARKFNEQVDLEIVNSLFKNLNYIE